MSDRAIFKCGTYPAPIGVTEFTLSGLNLDFAPGSVVVSLRQPAAAAPIVSAHMTGAPTADGFTVALSAPLDVDGYMLDWQAFAGVLTLEDADTLAVSYNDLMRTVADFLGRPIDIMTEDEKRKVDSFVQSGVRNFYYPPKMEGVDENFEWSFLRQKGGVDTMRGIASYILPDGFGRILGQIVFDEIHAPSIPLVPYGELIRRASANEVGMPRIAAISSRRDFGTKGQLKELRFYPTPDKMYSVSFVCDADDGRISEERPYPLGGAMFAELITESCLAVAEQRANDEAGLHTDNFNRLLISMIARDRKSGAQNYGMVGDYVNSINW